MTADGLNHEASLRALYAIIELLAQTKEVDEEKVWERIVQKLALALNAESGAYYAFQPSDGSLVLRYVLGEPSAAAKSPGTGLRVESGKGLVGWSILYKEPLVVQDAAADSRFAADADSPAGLAAKSALVLPLMDRLDLKGAVTLVNKRGGVFGEEDLALVRAACQAAATAVRAHKLELMMDKVAMRNASVLENLTGGFIAVDTHGRMILANPAARRILSIAPEIALNTPVSEALWNAPQVANILLDALATRKTARRQEVSWTFRGQTKLIGYSTIIIQDPQGQVGGAGINFQDITQGGTP